jgi:hypothetical protein
MAPEKLVKNIVEIAKNAVPKMPHKWSNVQGVSIKTPESMSLPIYNKAPQALKEIAQLAGIEEVIESPDKEDEVEKKDEAATNKKKRDMKSPLLKALKKQKNDDEEKRRENKTPPKKKESSEKKQKNKRTSSDSLVIETSVDADEKVAEKKATPKQKKQRTSSEGLTKDNAESGSAKKKKEAKKQKEAETPDSKAKSPKNKKADEESGERKDFVATKKFKGSKKGYVFRMGKHGVGYYVDVKPVIDQQKMDAILRMKKGNSPRGGQKKNKSKGTRRF